MDSFFGIGLFELFMIAIIALVVMGPERLPGAMREVAKYMKQLRSISHEFQSQFSEELKMLEEIDPRRILNEAIDPNSPASTTAAKPPAQVAPAAKSAAATSCCRNGGCRYQAGCSGCQACRTGGASGHCQRRAGQHDLGAQGRTAGRTANRTATQHA